MLSGNCIIVSFIASSKERSAAVVSDGQLSEECRLKLIGLVWTLSVGNREHGGVLPTASVWSIHKA